MCDYSLHDVKSRPAKVGDKLTTSTFPNTTTRGFAAVGEPGVAVCLLPGTELAFEANVVSVSPVSGREKDLGSKTARFHQINLDQPKTHHDALALANGLVVLVTNLREGQRATVLQLPAKAKPEFEKKQNATAGGVETGGSPARSRSSMQLARDALYGS